MRRWARQRGEVVYCMMGNEAEGLGEWGGSSWPSSRRRETNCTMSGFGEGSFPSLSTQIVRCWSGKRDSGAAEGPVNSLVSGGLTGRTHWCATLNVAQYCPGTWGHAAPRTLLHINTLAPQPHEYAYKHQQLFVGFTPHYTETLKEKWDSSYPMIHSLSLI